jgi:signal transduction histidine kinase
MLDGDNAHNERNWRSTISKRRFSIPEEVRLRGENPMLNLPSNFQLVGAVFVESTATGARTDRDLVTSMDREGFLSNEAFQQLVDIVRGGVEFLALQDRIRKQREAEERAKEAARQTRADLRAAVEYIEKSPTLARADKARLVEEYSGLARKLTEVEEYDREARRKLETMSALGVVAGFMTHEASRIFASLGDALAELERIAEKHPTLRPKVAEINQAYHSLGAHLDYTKTFIDANQKGLVAPFKVAPQVQRIVEKFGEFAHSRGISISCEIDKSVEAPSMPVAVYSGILLNLYTNALKAIVAAPSSEKSAKILFRAENDGRWHVLEVLDNGVGIPPNLRERVWDPLFTTTSSLNNRLGSGMGLGLSLVRDLVKQVGGRIRIVDPPAGYSTSFRVEFPRNLAQARGANEDRSVRR